MVKIGNISEPKESDICKAFIRRVKILKAWNYFKTDFEILHVANEQQSIRKNLKDIMYLKHLCAMGLYPGASDYMIMYKPGKMASIEFKRNKSSKLSNNQKVFKSRCEDLCIPYLCTYDVDEAVAFMEKLLC
jgi:hypothetical protein